MLPLNNPIWVMSSAFDRLSLPDLISRTQTMGAQGIDLCVFRRDGTRQDHVATHLDYEQFSVEDAKRTLGMFNGAGLKLSLGAFDNLIGGEEGERRKNQDHLLRLIRMAYLLGGDANNVKVGTFVGYNHELGNQDNGFEKNLEAYVRVFEPIIRYAEGLGVTILYENCPMEGWRKASFTSTFNNLTGVLAARKLLYALIPSLAHGEIYDPSHDVWQNTNPVDVIRETDPRRLHRIHVKATRNLDLKSRTYWGSMYPMQVVSPELAQKAGVPVPAHDWDRHHYEAMLPGFGGSDSMDWRAFVEAVQALGFTGPFEIENEARNSKDTGNPEAITQGFRGAIYSLMPMLWPLGPAGYLYDSTKDLPLNEGPNRDIPIVTMNEIQ